MYVKLIKEERARSACATDDFLAASKQQVEQHKQEMARRLESVEPQMQQHFFELHMRIERAAAPAVGAMMRACVGDNACARGYTSAGARHGDVGERCALCCDVARQTIVDPATGREIANPECDGIADGKGGRSANA